MNTKKKITFWLCIAGINIVLILLVLTIGELTVRWRYFKSFQLPEPLFVSKPIVHYGYNPDHSLTKGGFRSGPETKIKPKGAYRIICLGASTTAGYRIGNNTGPWPYQLEFYLNNHFSGQFDVINAAVAGYGTEHIKRQLSHLVHDYQPDLLIIYTGWNGTSLITDTAAYAPLGLSNPQDNVIKRLDNFISRNSLAYPRIKRRLERLDLLTRETASKKFEAYIDMAQLEESWVRDMEEIVSILERNHWPAIFVAFPYWENKHWMQRKNLYEKRIFSRLNYILDMENVSKNIHSVNLTKVFGDKIHEKNNPYFMDVMHMNENGSKIFARALGDSLSAIFNFHPKLPALQRF